ncbi:MAG TPA: YtrH family sporulation protein [Limnochordia bacterium]|nr:YtrH family sporulation protein [Limnochordia bacterium]
MLGNSLSAFFTAIGVILGASLVGSLASVLTGGSAFVTMNELARSVKPWAVAVAMGGTFSAIQAVETGLLRPAELAKLFVVILCSFMGAYTGHWLIRAVTATGIPR